MPVSEGIVGHKWTSMGTEENKEKYKDKAKDVLYDLHPKLEHNIVVSQKNLKDAETRVHHKGKKASLIQLESSSDPICSSAGCS